MAKKEEISIFGGAKTKAPSVAKKDDKEVVVVKGLEEKLLEFEFIKAQIKDLTAQEKTLNSEIKDIAKEKFVELYQSKRSNPNTFLIKDGEGCVMILPSDAYIKIGSEARANELMEAYGDDAVTVDEQFVFNNSVLQRNMKAIEKAIRDAKGVSDDDKRDLIDRIVEFKVAKGFIDRLYEYGENMETVMNDIQPIISLKSCGGGRMEDGGELDGDFMGNIYGDGESRVVSIEEVRDDGEFMDSYMIDESQAVSNAGEQESWFYNGKNYLITTWNERAVEHNDGDEEISVNDEYIGRVYTVWVGGSEVNDNLLTRSEAEDLANEYREDGYDDVVVVDNTYPISEGEYRKGGRVYETGRAYKRDRAYKSNQPHELAYHRKTRPKNPRYKKDTSFFADGGGVDNLLKDIDEGDVITIFKLKEYANDLIEGYRSIIKEEEYTILIDYDKEIAYYFTQDGADLTFVREEIFRKLDLDDKDDYADGGGVGDKPKQYKHDHQAHLLRIQGSLTKRLTEDELNLLRNLDLVSIDTEGRGFRTENEAKVFINETPYIRKKLREGNLVLVWNGKQYFIGEKNENAITYRFNPNVPLRINTGAKAKNFSKSFDDLVSNEISKYSEEHIEKRVAGRRGIPFSKRMADGGGVVKKGDVVRIITPNHTATGSMLVFDSWSEDKNYFSGKKYPNIYGDNRILKFYNAEFEIVSPQELSKYAKKRISGHISDREKGYATYADGGGVKTVFTKDGVEVEKGTDKYKGHIFYHSDGVGYMCLGYFPNLDDCKYRNMETGTEVVGCMDGFYYNNPMMAHGGMMHEGKMAYSHGGGKISTATLEAMVGRKLNGWNDDVVIYNGAKYQKLYLQSFYVMA